MNIFIVLHSIVTKLINRSINEGTSKQSFQKNTTRQTNKNKFESVEPDTKHLSSIPEKINISLNSKTAEKDCRDGFKILVSFSINIVLNDEILKDLTTNGLTISINLAK